jgi:hypothetical protein
MSSWEVVRGQILKSTQPRHVLCFWKPLRVRMKDYGYQRLSEAVRCHWRTLEAVRGHQYAGLKFSRMGPTLVPHLCLIWGTWGTFLLCASFWGTYFNQPMKMQEDIRGCQRSPIYRIEMFQDGSHFSASPVPHLRHLRHLLIVCLILRHLFQSTNENAGGHLSS